MSACVRQRLSAREVHTIAQNIHLARHDAKPEDLQEACAAAGILEEIAALPDGFETRIKGCGRGFSGSQQHRIGPDRALVRCPDILILNEALNAVEPRLEDRIQARICER